MPFSLSWALNRSIVTVNHSGIVTIAEIETTLDEIAQQSDPIIRPYMLVDLREVTEYPGHAEIALFNDAHYRRPRVSRATAFIVNDVTADPIRFLLLSGANRGMTARDFTDTTEALRWLLAHDDPDA